MFDEIRKNLREQDNRITAEPIFVVQQRKRVWGMDEDYTDSWAWVQDDYELHPEGPHTAEDQALMDELDNQEQCGELTGDWRKVWYVDTWVFVQPFFTEAAAQRYIDTNGHNLSEPRIYVESAYRNREWQAVRNALMGGELAR